MNKTAVIILGNTTLITKENYQGLYEDLYMYLSAIGFSPIFDPGLPQTTPPPAKLWIGHSRGAERLQYAPPQTQTIAIGSHRPDAINHPKEKIITDPKKFTALPIKQQRYHFHLDKTMKEQIHERIKKESQ